MQNLDEMSVSDKILKVYELVAKAMEDINYSTDINVPSGYDKESFYNHAKMIANNSKELISRLGSLDYQERQDASRAMNNNLDSVLSCFPEYRVSKTL